MLSQLRIKNFALIDELVLEPQDGLIIITGETGAGKSIILDALGLALGERADNARGIRAQEKCVIEAHFEVSTLSLKPFFESLELDYYDTAVLRREITADGRSRAFVNDTPVNLNVLKQLGYQLIHIHSQHENLALTNTAFQLEVVDTLAGTTSLLQKVKALFAEHASSERQLRALQEEQARVLAETEFKQFLLNELETLALNPGEGKSLEEAQQTLQHAEELKQLTSDASMLLSGNEQNITDSLHELKRSLGSYAKMNKAIAVLQDRINATLEELKDIAGDFEKLSGSFLHDPERLNEINERLSTIYNLVRKHRVSEADELLNVQDELAEFLSHSVSLEEEITKIQHRKTALFKSLIDEAKELSNKRKAVLNDAATSATKALSQLGMPAAQLLFEHQLLSEEQVTETGLDSIRILFTANKGSEPQSLSKVASGGELSRVMLVLKSLVAGRSKIPTLIFDEIDTGVSGETAVKIASLLAQLSAAHQVLTVTHLPQVAAKGKHHYKVYKEEKGQQTFTRLKLLSEEERVEEIAKMLQGEKPTASAYKNAREMLRHA